MRAKVAGGLAWSLTILLVMIGLLTAARRVYVLLDSPKGPPRFAAAAALDAGFAQQKLHGYVNRGGEMNG